jgi:hypothetical protein
MSNRTNKPFRIEPADLDLVEQALRAKAAELSRRLLDSQDPQATTDEHIHLQMSEIQSVLGKLHNQKIWHNPKQYAPLG